MTLEFRFHDFGKGRLDLDQIDLSSASDEDKAKFFGWRLGCPVVPTLIKERGAKAMSKRYASLLFQYSYLIDQIAKKDLGLAQRINGQIGRMPGELLKRHDRKWLGTENLAYNYLVGPETVVGYALPRMLLAFTFENGEQEAGTRLVKSLNAFDVALENELSSYDELAFLLFFGEELFNEGGDPKLILRNMISKGKLEQDQCHIDFETIIASMEEFAPNLWGSYSSLSSEEKEKLGIAAVK